MTNKTRLEATPTHASPAVVWKPPVRHWTPPVRHEIQIDYKRIPDNIHNLIMFLPEGERDQAANDYLQFGITPRQTLQNVQSQFN